MSPAWLAAWLAVIGGLAGCPGPAVVRPGAPGADEPPRATLADNDATTPPYGTAELQQALIAERAAEASLERRIAELEAWQARAPADPAGLAEVDERLRASADLAVRRRYIATLEACQASGRWCPPRLDDPPWLFEPDHDASADPPLTVALRYDLDSWRAIASELHGRACACRTIGCVDTVGVAIDRVEGRPLPRVQSDERAATAITRARECLFRLRGRSAMPAAPAPAGGPAAGTPE